MQVCLKGTLAENVLVSQFSLLATAICMLLYGSLRGRCIVVKFKLEMHHIPLSS